MESEEQETRKRLRGGAPQEVGTSSSGVPGWLVPTLWIMLGLVTLSLIGLAVVLLVRMRIFSAKVMTDEQIKSLWAFLGVALGVVVTLIGTLLTEQHNRRTDSLAWEAARQDELAKANQKALAEQSEKRLALDTIAKVLELITVETNYTPSARARVAGAVATMMELRGGGVAIRILGDLWKVDAIDGATAMWLIQRILADKEAENDDKTQAASLIFSNAHKLIPSADDPDQGWLEWPEILYFSWPSDLDYAARSILFDAVLNVLMAREPQYWAAGPILPVETLYKALEDPDFSSVAAYVLRRLSEIQSLATIGFNIDTSNLTAVEQANKDRKPTLWFQRFVDRFEPWAAGASMDVPRAATTSTPNAPESSPVAGSPVLPGEVKTSSPRAC